MLCPNGFAHTPVAPSSEVAASPALAPGSLRKLFLAGDVMLGRGIDAILENSVSPVLHEDYMKDARGYVNLAVQAHGPLPAPAVRWARPGAYIWGDALEALKYESPDVRIINLETALTADGTHEAWKGIHYRCHPRNARCFAVTINNPSWPSTSHDTYLQPSCNMRLSHGSKMCRPCVFQIIFFQCVA